MSKFWSTSIIVLTVTIFSFAAHGNSYINRIRKNAESGDSDAQFLLGVRYYFGKGVQKNYSEAVNWFLKAAQQEHMKAEFNLGVCYYFGKGVEKDFVKAVSWYRKAAEKGFPNAQYYLAKCFYHGDGVGKDLLTAKLWYHKAAEKGFAKAQYVLGNICCWVNFDFKNGIYWYRKAAEQGHADAQFQLGKCYAVGIGVPQDEWEAKGWIGKAASKNKEAEKIMFSFNSFDTKQGRREKIGEWSAEYNHRRFCKKNVYNPEDDSHTCLMQ